MDATSMYFLIWSAIAPICKSAFPIQQGLEIRGFWFQKKTVQLKTPLREVYTYVLNGFFFQKTVYLQGFWPKSVYLKAHVAGEAV